MALHMPVIRHDNCHSNCHNNHLSSLGQVGRDGNCLVNAVVAQLQFKTEDDDMLYTGMYLRRQFIGHFLVNFERFKEEIMEDIKMEYGRIDSEEGPFSVKQWCQYILTDQELLSLYFCETVSFNVGY